MVSTPRHFESSTEFSMFILECAISDRRRFLECYEHMTDEDSEKLKRETKAEINAINMRKRRLRRRTDAGN